MARPLFEIAAEILTDWQTPSPQAKSYVKGMFYLLGMDDRAADLDASTTVRMFLLYSKTWTGPVADRVKAELQVMRSANAPTNAQLLSQRPFTPCQNVVTHCEVCDAALGEPAKFVEGYTHWKACVRMCMHCNYFVSTGLCEGNGALYLVQSDGIALKLYGEPKFSVEAAANTALDLAPSTTTTLAKPDLRFHLKLLGRKVVKRCTAIVSRLTKRSA